MEKRRPEHQSYIKTLICNQILKPTWVCGTQLWGCVKDTYVNMIHAFQNKVLHAMMNAP